MLVIVTPTTLVVVHSTCLSAGEDVTVLQLVDSCTNVVTLCIQLFMYAEGMLRDSWFMEYVSWSRMADSLCSLVMWLITLILDLVRPSTFS